MSDLLSNLVSKTLNVAPIIEPRPLSRFEPWQPAGAVEATLPSLDMELDRPPAVARIEVDPSAPPPNRVVEPPHTAHATHQPPSEPEVRFVPSPEPALPAHRQADVETVVRAPIERVVPEPITSDRQPIVSERIERVIVEHSLIERAEPDRSMRESIARAPEMPPLIEAQRAPEQPPTIIERIERLIVEHDHSDQPRVETRSNSDDHDQRSSPIVRSDSVRLMPTLETSGHVDTIRATDRSEQPGPAPTVLPRVESIDAQRTIIERPPADRVPAARPLVVPSVDVLPLRNTSTDGPPPHAPRPRPVPIIERLPARPPVDLNARSTGTPPPPPTIHVSIGRVDVRATLPAAPVKRSSTSTSSTSLDDYLRWRSGDRR